MDDAALCFRDQLLQVRELRVPARGPDHISRPRFQGRGGVGENGVRLGEIDADRAAGGEVGALQGHHGLVVGIAQDGRDLAAHLAVADHGHLHRRSSKNSWCRRRTARSASPSATTKEKFTSEAPKEIITTFTSRRVWKTRAARPGWRLKPRPITLTIAICRSTSTSPRRPSSSSTAGTASGSSTVSEIETSEVAMRSTGVRWRSNTSKTRATNPYAISMRGWAMRMTAMPFLNAMARGSPRSLPS